MTLRHLLATAMLWLVFMTIGQAQILQEINLLYPNQTKPIVVKAEVEDDFLLIEEDIIVGTMSELTHKGVTISADSGKKWSNGTIPYLIEADHPSKSNILEAINQVNHLTNLCLKERENETSYVLFKLSNRCSSHIGMIGLEQAINLASGCSTGIIIHEIMHTAGFYHEHTRSDRDHYITVHEDEIKEGFEFNFNKNTNAQDVGEYDYASIMHYGSYNFTRNGVANITINTPPGNSSTVIGQRDGLSAGDIASINLLYPQVSDCTTYNFACHESGRAQEMEDNWVHWNGPSILNLGNTTSDPVTVGIYLSANAYISASTDLKIGEIILPSIEVGAAHNFDFQVDFTNLRERYGTRNYYFGLVIDPNNEVEESNEHDNAGCPAFFESEPATDSDDDSTNDGGLAVNLLDFSVESISIKTNQLKWITNQEVNFSHYEIERSSDGKNWKYLHHIPSQGEDDWQRSYTWNDNYLPQSTQIPILYYRLKMVDKDDSFEHSNIKNIKNKNIPPEWNIYPNPSTGNINIISSEQSIEHCLIKITDFTGKVIYQIDESLFSDKIGLNLSHLPSGIYWLQIGNNDQVHTEKIVLTK